MPQKKFKGLSTEKISELFKSPEAEVKAKVSLDSFLEGFHDILLESEVFPAVLCRIVGHYQKSINSFDEIPTQCPEEYKVKLGLYKAMLDTYNNLLEQEGLNPKYFPSS